jgi:hypothetical protein
MRASNAWLIDDRRVVEVPARRRGRPKKPTHKTPCEIPFDVVTGAIQAIPTDKAGDPTPGRNQVKDRARAIVSRDKRCASAARLFNTMLDELRWTEGRCCYSIQWFANALGNDRSTIVRRLRDLEDGGHILRRAREKAGGDWDQNEYTIPALLMALDALNTEGRCKEFEGVGANNSERRCTEAGGIGANMHGGGCKNAPLPSETPSEGSCSGSARARESSAEEAVQSFWSGADLGKADELKPIPPDGLTEHHLERWRELADRFARRPGAMIVGSTARSESDPILIEMVRSELEEYPATIVARTVTAALLAAAASQISAQQDGSAGRGRGGIVSLQRYVRPMLRSTANDMMREDNASEAKNRSEKAAQEIRHATRLGAVQAAKRRRQAPRSMGDALRAAFATAHAGDET